MEIYESPITLNTNALQNRDMFFQTLRNRILEKICVTMPAQIISYDRDTHKAMIQPMLNYNVRGHGAKVCTPFTVEILRLMAGGFLIDFPIVEGDTGWLIAVDRDCFQVKAISKPSLPTNPEVNTYTTGFWIPDQWGSEEKLKIPNIDEYDKDRLVIQTRDGTQKISIGNKDIRISATNVSVSATENATIMTTGSTNVVAQSVNINSPQVSTTGSLSVGNGATGVASSSSVLTIENGIVTKIG